MFGRSELDETVKVKRIRHCLLHRSRLLEAEPVCAAAAWGSVVRFGWVVSTVSISSLTHLCRAPGVKESSHMWIYFVLGAEQVYQEQLSNV